MEFDQLKGFYFVAKLGSFTAAASRLYLTQPAISLYIGRVGCGLHLASQWRFVCRLVEEIW